MEERTKKILFGSGLVAAFALAGGIRYLMKERATPEPPYLVYHEDGDFEIRDYSGYWVAETYAYGDRREAIRAGFRTLADYIFAKSHDGESIPMTAPVIERAEGTDKWRVQFVMPEGETEATLPPPPAGVSLRHEEAMRVAVVRFSGAPGEYDLEAQDDTLREWLSGRDEGDVIGEPLYAFYNSPSVPGPLRRNEIWLPLALEPPVAY